MACRTRISQEDDSDSATVRHAAGHPALLCLVSPAVAIPRALAQINLSGPAPAAALRVTHAPTLVHQIAPVYSPAAHAERLAGVVDLAIPDAQDLR